MERTLRPHMLLGLAAAAGLAAMISAATAPTARADSFTDVITDVETELGYGQTYFGDAATAFGSNEDTTGLALLLVGIDDDSLAAPNSLIADSVSVLSGESVYGPVGFNLEVPADFSDGLSYAQSFFEDGVSDISDAATFFSAGEYGDGFIYDLFGADYATIVPLEELLLGSLASL
jgi:hypothetical protein